MKVAFFDYQRLWLDERDKMMSIIDDISSRGGFIMQNDLEKFERNLALYTKSNYAVGVGNATDAMEIFLQALNISKGDEIIISSHTMLATASAIKVNGGVPVPVDIGEDNLIDYEAIEDAITPNTVGIMPTQLNGRTCKMDLITSIAEKNSLFVVEDAAQSLGSKYKGKSAGTFGLASCISFFPAKVLGCFGDAGAVLTQDTQLYEKIYQIHDHGRDLNGEVKLWGRNSRLDNVQAGILDYKLSLYQDVISRRRDLARMYQEQLLVLEQLKLPPGPENHSDHFDVFQNYEITADDRDNLKTHLSNKGIGTLIQWGGKGVHQFHELGFNMSLPKTEAFFKSCIMLPMNAFISHDDVTYICESIKGFYNS
jgi:dTDP-4-amino-4,6-dideoxygalactose transaminase